MLLHDELFKDNDDTIIDECMTFMSAGTQTVSTLVTNAVYYLTVNKEIRDKVREEFEK